MGGVAMRETILASRKSGYLPATELEGTKYARMGIEFE
jgi:hypothetical protein